MAATPSPCVTRAPSLHSPRCHPARWSRLVASLPLISSLPKVSRAQNQEAWAEWAWRPGLVAWVPHSGEGVVTNSLESGGAPWPLALQPRLHRARHQSLRSQRHWHHVSIRAQVEMPPVSQLTPKNQGSRTGRRTLPSQLLCSQHSQQHPGLGRGCLLTLTAQQTPQATPRTTGAFPRSHSPDARAATESQFLTVLEAHSLRRRCWQGWLASSGVSPGASSSFSLCLHIPGVSSGAQLFPFLLKTTVRLDEISPMPASFNLNYLLKAQSPDRVTF